MFWNEFASCFNFIAVDYLIYTREVIGNLTCAVLLVNAADRGTAIRQD